MTHLPYSIIRAEMRARLDSFAREEDASLSVESVLVIPFLLWAFLGIYTFFDVYRAKNLALKANYALSDLFSRETATIDQDYLDGAASVFEYLTQSAPGPWVRVTVVYCDDDCASESRSLRRDWSKATDGVPSYSEQDIADYLEPIIPWIGEGERVIIVETSIDYKPPFSKAFTGIGERTFFDIVMTRPRFAPQLCWQGENCGT